MNRRELLRGLARCIGAAITLPFVGILKPKTAAVKVPLNTTPGWDDKRLVYEHLLLSPYWIDLGGGLYEIRLPKIPEDAEVLFLRNENPDEDMIWYIGHIRKMLRLHSSPVTVCKSPGVRQERQQ